MDESVFSPCLQWWIILVCSRCFWTCYPVSFLTGASFWQMIAARCGVLPQVLIFPGCLDIIILETATLLMSLALRSSAQRGPSLAYQMLSLKMVEVWESKMNGYLCIIFFENWIEDLWCSLTWHTSHLSCWHIALYSAAHGAFDDVSEIGNSAFVLYPYICGERSNIKNKGTVEAIPINQMQMLTSALSCISNALLRHI